MFCCDCNLWNYFLIASVTFVIYKLFFKNRNLKNSLPNKVVLITGASNGIGESLAHVFYLAGCRVVLAARRISELERVKKDLLETHSTRVTHPPIIIQMDLADINSLADKVKQVIDIHGQIDILVNNAGISFFGAIIDTTFEAQLKVFMTNYFGLSALTRAVLPSMIKRKDGRIVCISSVLGKFSAPYREPYTATKHAVQAFCDSLRAEVNEYNIKVTNVSPGYVATDVDKNSVNASGQRYDKEDTNVTQGASSMDMAKSILRAILNDEKDPVICDLRVRLAIWLRFICPPIFFMVMNKRALTHKHEI